VFQDVLSFDLTGRSATQTLVWVAA
jgi:hypothetical protein